MDKIMDLNLGINVVFCGIAIVFLMLLILIGVMCIFGLFSKKNNKPKKVEPKVETKAEKPVAPVVADGVDDETVAAITAAIYCLYNGSNVSPKITFIKPAQSRPAWAKAGIAQNTKAF